MHEITENFFVDYAIGEAFGAGRHEMIDEGGINEEEQNELRFDRSAWNSSITAMLTERKKWICMMLSTLSIIAKS